MPVCARGRFWHVYDKTKMPVEAAAVGVGGGVINSVCARVLRRVGPWWIEAMWFDNSARVLG